MKRSEVVNYISSVIYECGIDAEEADEMGDRQNIPVSYNINVRLYGCICSGAKD